MKLSTSRKTHTLNEESRVIHPWQTGYRNSKNFTSIYLDVVVYNKGRSPVDLVELWLLVHGDDLWRGTSVLRNDELPVRIEHGSMRASAVDLVEFIDELQDDEAERVEFFIVEAKLGNGKTVQSNPIPLSVWVMELKAAEDFAARIPPGTSAKKDENIQ